MTDSKKVPHQRKSGNSFFAGVLTSILFCMLYLKLGYTPPTWLQPFGKLQNFLTQVAVSVFIDEQNILEVQRKIALDLGWNPHKFVELDTTLEHFISEEYYWQQQGMRKIGQLQTKIRAMKRNEEAYANLQDSFDRLLPGLPEEARKEHLFIRNYLKKRFPGDTDQEIISKLATYGIDDIIQRPGVNPAIHFQPVTAANVQVEITDDAGNVVRRLVDASLPAGQYWLYWDRKDDLGRKTAVSVKYFYRVLYNGREETGGQLDQRKWETEER